MCGIAGFFNTFPDVANHDARIAKMVSMIEHRGPDELGIAVDDYMAMGTARLSILDLGHGQQPMKDETSRYHISYNGELYNYIELKAELEKFGVRFNTNSDTEVVLRAYIHWGAAAFERFNGGYAFAVYDAFDKSMLLCRDRFGKRPLFYTKHERGVIFASEQKCFLPLPEFSFSFDAESLSDIFTLWTPLPEQSAFKNIRQVPPGSYITFDVSGLGTTQNYYSLPSHHPNITDVNEAANRVREVLDDAVSIRLRSDVEVGTYLSGGLDSSVISVLTAQHTSKQLKTFSIQFESEQFDESHEQLIMSRAIDSEHHTLRIGSVDIVDNFGQACYHAEVPVFRTAFVPMYMLSQRVREAGVKVALTGEGADEAFLGYNIFKELLVRRQWGGLHTQAEKEAQVAKLYPYLSHFQSNIAQYSALFEQFSSSDDDMLFSHALRFHNSKMSTRLVTKKSDALDKISHKLSFQAGHHDAMYRSQWLEYSTLLHGYLLSTQGDRMSFAHGVETRMPFMDSRVVALANQLALQCKIDKNFDEKYVLKLAFRDLIPSEILAKSKQPYRAPDASAFLDIRDAEWAEMFYDSETIRDMDFLDQKFVQRFINKVFASEPGKISQRENQTYIFLLSLMHLNQQYVKTDREIFRVSEKVVCRYDGRQEPGQF